METVLPKKEMKEKVKTNMLNAAMEQICQAELTLEYYESKGEPETDEEKKNLAGQKAKLLAAKGFNEDFISYLEKCD